MKIVTTQESNFRRRKFIQRLTHNKWEDGLGIWARNEKRP